MPAQSQQLAPHRSHQPKSVRKAYIQNLTDLLHVCLLRRDLPRAQRAWSILIRCREADWKSRWYWGLECLNAITTPEDGIGEGRETERWLKTVRISAKEVEKPALLHALVLHLIRRGHYRQALDELETYLSSYPYLLSGPLHTYAGLLCFYLAQPPSAVISTRPSSGGIPAPTAAGHGTDSEPSSRATTPITGRSTTSNTRLMHDPPNPILIRQARAFFVKALALDDSDDVANGFIDLIDHPDDGHGSVSGVDESREEQDGSVSLGEEDEEGDNKSEYSDAETVGWDYWAQSGMV